MDILEITIQQTLDNLLTRACNEQIPDVHFMPTTEGYDVLFRYFDTLVKIEQLTDEQVQRIVTYVKYLANLNIAENRKPQSGAFYKMIQDKQYHFRMSTLPSILNKESVVIRIHQPHITLQLSELAYFPTATEQLEQLLMERQGIVFVTGATGSGKTTTLYACLQYVAEHLRKHVITLEDPVEVVYEHALQIQVNERAGITYASGLRAILRHTPDVIFVGEIRDEETAQIAVRAALTGHLVLTTIHAKDTISCIYRLLDFGVSLDDIRQTLRGIVAQTLVTITEEGQQLRRALFEVLAQHELNRALIHVQANERYTLPRTKQLHYQQEVVMNLEHANAKNISQKA